MSSLSFSLHRIKSDYRWGWGEEKKKKLLPLQHLKTPPHPRAPQSESLWVLTAADGCVCGCVFVCLCEGVRLTTRLQLCCSVLDSIGGAESYRVSVSCVGSPASVQGLDSVPAPQSQKNLQQGHQKWSKLVKLNANTKYFNSCTQKKGRCLLFSFFFRKSQAKLNKESKTSRRSYRSCRINSTSCPW